MMENADKATLMVNTSRPQGEFYVNNGMVFTRESLPYTSSKTTLTADGNDSIVITLPMDCAVTVDAIEYLCPDSEFEFSTTHKGTYLFLFTKFPFIPSTLEVTAT